MPAQRHDANLTSYPSTYLDCRENHLWRFVTDFQILRGTRGAISEFKRQKKCTNCGVRVTKTYDGRTGRVVRSNYDYTEAPGYLSNKDNRFDTSQARLEALRRALEGQTVELVEK